MTPQEATRIYDIGCAYYYGTNGYPLNRNKAFEYYTKAASLGVSNAMNNLGIMYQNGEVVARNYRIAADWFYRALKANTRNALAAHNLACLYYDGLGVGKDIEKAYKFFKASVDLGSGNTHKVYPRSCYFVGCILLEYYKNAKDAWPYFLEAAEHGGIAEAYHNLGFLSEKGVVPLIQLDTNETVTREQMTLMFYEKAAERGYVPAMDSVGRIYASVHMFKEAKPWIEKAAALGYEPAKKRLKYLKVAQGGSLFNLFT